MSQSSEVGTIPLPDIKEVLRKKELEEEMARIEEDEEASKVRINRKDRKALARVSIIGVL